MRESTTFGFTWAKIQAVGQCTFDYLQCTFGSSQMNFRVYTSVRRRVN